MPFMADLAVCVMRGHFAFHFRATFYGELLLLRDARLRVPLQRIGRNSYS
jgi:hypothetical protein